MITHVLVSNFKSLQNFELDLGKITFLIGLNGVGKSTVLQALSFIAAVVQGEISHWLEMRSWKASDIRRKGVGPITILSVDVAVDGAYLRWLARFNSASGFLKCTFEEFRVSESENFSDSKVVLRVLDGKLETKEKSQALGHLYEGSILGSWSPELLPSECIQFLNEIKGLRSLDLLSPQDMRYRSKDDGSGEIGERGERIAASLASLPREIVQERILPQLKKFFPSIVSINTKRTRGGWVELWIGEAFASSGKPQETIARHCNDGMLRILAILTQLSVNRGFTCFDEIENGISIDLLIELMDFMRKSESQVLLTTHSIVALNFIEEKNIVFLFKDNNGITRAVKFEQIPSAKEKLEYYAPGDAISLLTLNELTQQAKNMILSGNERDA